MPFAPHIAEEIWEIPGCKEPLSNAPYPEIDEKLLEDDVIIYVVQVNGKLRGSFELPKNQPQDVVFEAAKKHPQISKYMDGKELQKVIFVPNKLLNLVLKG
jgi:leucyl-tRNA synthetase